MINRQNNLKDIKQEGFTLIELLVVISIIGILSSVVLASIVSAKKKAQDSVVTSTRVEIQKQLDVFNLEYGGYPNDGDGEATAYCIGTTEACLDAHFDSGHTITFDSSNINSQNKNRNLIATAFGSNTFSFPAIKTFPSYDIDGVTVNYITYIDCPSTEAVCPVDSSDNSAKLLAATSEGYNEYKAGTWKSNATTVETGNNCACPDAMNCGENNSPCETNNCGSGHSSCETNNCSISNDSCETNNCGSGHQACETNNCPPGNQACETNTCGSGNQACEDSYNCGLESNETCYPEGNPNNCGPASSPCYPYGDPMNCGPDASACYPYGDPMNCGSGTDACYPSGDPMNCAPAHGACYNDSNPNPNNCACSS